MSQDGGCSCFWFSPHGRPHRLYSLNRFCFDGLLFFFMSWWVESSKDADTSLCAFPQSVHRRHLPMNCQPLGPFLRNPQTLSLVGLWVQWGAGVLCFLRKGRGVTSWDLVSTLKTCQAALLKALWWQGACFPFLHSLLTVKSLSHWDLQF